MTEHDTPTTLYRLHDDDGALLYVGIAGNPGRRFEQHRKEKPWWGDVASITLEHFKSREAASVAELEAIRSECPQHNIMGRTSPTIARARRGSARYFCNDGWGHARTSPELELVWEIDYGSVSDDFMEGEDDPHDVMDVWLDAIRDKYPKTVPIYWFVDGFGFESAPFSKHHLFGHDFLSFFSWPTDADGMPINWLTLPVNPQKCWWVEPATGWKPSIYQSDVEVDLLRMGARANRGYLTSRPPFPEDMMRIRGYRST